ncbi:MAG: NnrU family protein [Tropicimonas sp.]|uniref:NnrU family protein n=1 Tax=Tropicimonas sp. TaxID=2067044 RepID=UPI003A86E010
MMTSLFGWGGFAATIAVFLLSHSIPVRPAVKAALVARLGTGGFTAAYSALSVLALAWMIWAAGRAPVVHLWPWSPWQNYVTAGAMALACLIAALAIGQPNPLSFGGAHDERFDPAGPGIVGWVRHPLLVALLLWSCGHLVPNGQLAHIILFGLFAAFAWLGMRMIDRRNRRLLGMAEWQRLATTSRHIRPSVGGCLRAAAAGIVFMGLLHLHGPVIGVAPAF